VGTTDCAVGQPLASIVVNGTAATVGADEVRHARDATQSLPARAKARSRVAVSPMPVRGTPTHHPLSSLTRKSTRVSRRLGRECPWLVPGLVLPVGGRCERLVLDEGLLGCTFLGREETLSIEGRLTA
jgi:hypothetical protein